MLGSKASVGATHLCAPANIVQACKSSARFPFPPLHTPARNREGCVYPKRGRRRRKHISAAILTAGICKTGLISALTPLLHVQRGKHTNETRSCSSDKDLLLLRIQISLPGSQQTPSAQRQKQKSTKGVRKGSEMEMACPDLASAV